MEKDQNRQKQISKILAMIREASKGNTYYSGLVPKKIKSKNNIYEMGASIKDRVLYSKSKINGAEVFVLWKMTNHDKIKRNLVSEPIICEKDIEIIKVKDDFVEICKKESLPADNFYKYLDKTILEKMKKEHLTHFPWKLIEEQSEIMEKPLPLIVSGSAGSGKTIIGIYRLVYELRYNPEYTALYVTLTNGLANYAKKVVHSICTNDELKRVRIYSYNDLCNKEILKKTKKPISYEYYLNKFPNFYYQYSGRSRRENIPFENYWEWIRAYLKGSVRQTVREKHILDNVKIKPTLSQNELKKLPQKKRPEDDNIKKIVEVGKAYQAFLKENNICDDIDIARLSLETKNKPEFDIIFCDEMQDFTELQLALLFKLAKNETACPLYLSGDEGQIIQPSGFHNADAKDLIFTFTRRNKVKTEVLSKNFRNPSGIVEFANKIINERQKYWGHFSHNENIEYGIEGEKPYYHILSDNDFNQLSDSISSETMILVKTEQEKNDLVKKYPKIEASLFTISESKGLEYQHVILYNFLEHFLPVYQNCLNGFTKKHMPNVRLLFNLLFVATTRAIKSLLFIDSRERLEQAISLYLFKDLNSVEWNKYLTNQLATGSNWAQRAKELFQNQNFHQAYLAYQKAELYKESYLSLGKFNEQKGDYDEALSNYLEGHVTDEAIRLSEELGKRKTDVLEMLINENKLIEVARITIGKDDPVKNYDEICSWLRENDSKKLIIPYLRALMNSLHEELETITNDIETVLIDLV